MWLYYNTGLFVGHFFIDMLCLFLYIVVVFVFKGADMSLRFALCGVMVLRRGFLSRSGSAVFLVKSGLAVRVCPLKLQFAGI